jgi:trans-2,3-dihydro-3-hydroxyanthranilate isomerase
METVTVDFVHVDVFASAPYSGNSVAVVYDSIGLDSTQMLTVTKELRHFETIFVRARRGRTTPEDEIDVRVFDLLEELPFAGHPTLGAAATLHHDAPETGTATWRLRYADRTVPVTVQISATGWKAELDAGRPARFLGVPRTELPNVAAAFGLGIDSLCDDLPVEVGSTGLRYLVVPVTGELERASVAADLTPLLARLGADFAYVIDVDALEGRHWNNDGVIEDIATGSAAGVVGAYLVHHGRVPAGRPIELLQGRFVGRPSKITVTADGPPHEPERVRVAGEVRVVATGTLLALPKPAAS